MRGPAPGTRSFAAGVAAPKSAAAASPAKYVFELIVEALHRSSTTSPSGREQQMSAAPGAGGSTGSGP
jgi:hypothetical protein